MSRILHEMTVSQIQGCTDKLIVINCKAGTEILFTKKLNTLSQMSNNGRFH